MGKLGRAFGSEGGMEVDTDVRNQLDALLENVLQLAEKLHIRGLPPITPMCRGRFIFYPPWEGPLLQSSAPKLST